ncbi:MAG TPA: FAD-dependent oxidoreductase, partial [Actinomycetes bacterium]|nr:FAD-dependent oxidoreductase [Actinomycetes bacterium]
RWHGLLHSGARYAVRDQESARECIEENTTLRRIAPHTIEDIGGLFALLPGDDEAYAGQFVEGCRASGIPTEELSAAAAHRREPLLAPDVKLAFAVPDGGIDSWSLLRSMAADAEARGCRVLVRHPLVGVERDGDRITAVRVHDAVAGQDRTIGCQWVVNAAGAWAGEVGRMAGVPLKMIAGKGVMVVMASRYVRGVINACRKPADGDIIVPQHEVAILGTTSEQVPSADDIAVPPADVDRMIDMCAQMVPALASGRVLRAFAGSRPLYVAEPPADGGDGGGDTRAVSRNFTVIDHPRLDGLDNMYSIVGGKLTTCRQMAEAVVDRLAERMGVTEPCRTATELLPGADHGTHRVAEPLARVERDQTYGELICECELVTRGQVREAVNDGLTELEDLRRKVRLGYGPCQAAFCAWRAAGMLAEGSGRRGPGNPEGVPRSVGRGPGNPTTRWSGWSGSWRSAGAGSGRPSGATRPARPCSTTPSTAASSTSGARACPTRRPPPPRAADAGRRGRRRGGPGRAGQRHPPGRGGPPGAGPGPRQRLHPLGGWGGRRARADRRRAGRAATGGDRPPPRGPPLPPGRSGGDPRRPGLVLPLHRRGRPDPRRRPRPQSRPGHRLRHPATHLPASRAGGGPGNRVGCSTGAGGGGDLRRVPRLLGGPVRGPPAPD